MHRIVVLVLVCGCVSDALVPCGELDCPAGDVCVGTRCAAPSQLSACAQLPDGADCNAEHAAGKCTGGICTPVVCGNGVLDPGEVCDDGNQSSGDGCSATCTSNEQCGNGIVDIAVGEGCDCGGPSNLSPLCTGPNAADPSAECGLDCKPRYCGDGIVNTIEQCDGSVPDSVTCADYGYYSGTVTCQACQFSPASCSGRCGDGTIDSDHGEYCDVALPSDGSCMAFGYDNGNLTCGIGCGADLADCRQWGWERALPVVSRVASLDAAAGLVAVAFDTGDAYVLAQGSWRKAPDHYQLVATTPTKAWAIGSDAVAVWDGTTWTPLTPPWPADTTLSAARASDALGLFVAHNADGVLDRYNGSWSQIADAGWGAAPQFAQTHSVIWIEDYFITQSWTFDGTTWTPTAPAPFVSDDDSGVLWAAIGGGLSYWDGTTWIATGAPGGNGIAAGRGGMFVGSIQSAAGGHHTEELWFHGQPPVYVSDLPSGASENAEIASGPDNMIYAGAADGLYQLTRGEWTAYQTDVLTYNVVRGGRLSYGGAGYGGDPYGGATYGATYALDDDNAFEARQDPAPGCGVTVVTSRGDELAACGQDTPAAAIWEAGVNVASGVDADLLWTADDDSSAAASGANVFAWRDATAWQSMPTTLHPLVLDGDAVGDLYAIDAQQGLMHFDGLAWTQLASDAWTPLVVTPARVYFNSSQGPKMIVRATGSITDAPLRPGTTLLVGGLGEELFAVAPAETRGSSLWHYDGSVWSPVRMPAGVQPEFMYGLGRSLVIVPMETTPAVPPTYILERVRGW